MTLIRSRFKTAHEAADHWRDLETRGMISFAAEPRIVSGFLVKLSGTVLSASEIMPG